MNKLFRKILVIMPVVLLGLVYLYDHYRGWPQFGGKRLLLFVLTIFLLYGWMIGETMARKQDSLAKIAIQSSFYIYVFMVLTLTGYFILFREIPGHDAWDRMMQRIARKDRVNLEPLKIFRHYELSHKQIVGNLALLMPMGVYLPLLYRVRGFFAFLVICLCFSVLIEFLQLVTSYRSTDIDDIILNTTGACAGYLLFRSLRSLIGYKRANSWPAYPPKGLA
ncbi:MAG TPA: VanZ family protein [Flavisolibacter sp.]|nr:VanZ family protein [Flavisolibacter sp.]